MHSRKSILNKGIVFILSLFTTMLLSSINVKAAECGVSFSDGQYITIGGDSSTWEDTQFSVTGTGCSFGKVNSIEVNGKTETGDKFTTNGRLPGHYTIAYNYTYNDGTGNKEAVAYRYVRILDDTYNTSSNYTLANFDPSLSGASIVDSFVIGDDKFVHFFVTGTNTHMVLTDSLGRIINVDGDSKVEIKANTSSFVAKEVLQLDAGNDVYRYYLVGNYTNATSNVGVLAVQQLSLSAGVFSSSNVVDYVKQGSTYNGGYLDGETIYLAGKDSSSYPVVDKLGDVGLENVYTYDDVTGEYKDLILHNGEFYAVGYEKSASASKSSELFSYSIENDVQTTRVLKSAIEGAMPETIFHDIVVVNDKLIIVGESDINEIYTTNGYVKNQRQGYLDAIILEVALDGKTIYNAYMAGGNVDDRFTSIKQVSSDEYLITGTMSDDSSNLAYRLKPSAFDVSEDITSSKSDYKINGLLMWKYGYAYYGEISTFSSGRLSILGVYYPKTSVSSIDPLFLSADIREFENIEEINLVVRSEGEKYASYPVKFGLRDAEGTLNDLYYRVGYDEADTGVINTTYDDSLLPYRGAEKIAYSIESNTGVKIFVYRVVNITKEATPINLSSSTTGILKWYVYNRAYTHMSGGNHTRLDFTGFKYEFADLNQGKTIEDMINNYVDSGTSKGYSFVFGAETKTFTSYNQTNAAFATIENAKKYAYYQEFSRVVKVNDGVTTVNKLGAKVYTKVDGEIVTGSTNNFYVYYIDYKGANGDVGNCEVSETAITNCSNEGGYAFYSLEQVKSVIEKLIVYNNYFVSTRNTLYNGSVAESLNPTYNQKMTTDEYVTSLGFSNTASSNLTINVVTTDGTVVYSGKGRNLYFGGNISEKISSSIDEGTGEQIVTTTYSYTNSAYKNLGTQTVNIAKLDGSTINYYFNDNIAIVTHNACYNVYYSYVVNGEVRSTGTAKKFCLDTKAPVIVYQQTNSDTPSRQDKESSTEGHYYDDPSYIGSDFRILGLDDLDPYSFIYVNGNRYPGTCGGNESKTCEEDIELFIRQEIYQDKENPTRVNTITFSDRTYHTITWYFVIGSKSPTISIEDQTKTEFTLVIKFYDSNPITTFTTSVFAQACNDDATNGCYDPTEEYVEEYPSITDLKSEFATSVYQMILATNYLDYLKNESVTKEVYIDEGVYTLDVVSDGVVSTISYVIDGEYIIEVSGASDPHTIDSNGLFTYNEDTYMYVSETPVIYKVKLEDTGDEEPSYIIDESVNPIPVLNDVFKFEKDGREYQIINDNGILKIDLVPLKYEIKDNTFTIGDFVYTYDSEKEMISYTNPNLDNLYVVSLDFTRTIVNDEEGNITVTGGVDVPVTTILKDKNGNNVVHPLTGQNAYVFVEEEGEIQTRHFNLVDGVYNFYIHERFYPERHKAQATINVAELDFKIGTAVEVGTDEHGNKKPLELKSGMYSYEAGEDSGKTIALSEIGDIYKYPIDPEYMVASQLSTYPNTYFVNQTVYATFTFRTDAVFSIRMYTQSNSYGLPVARGSNCKTLVIYGAGFGENPPKADEDYLCGISETEYLSIESEEHFASVLNTNSDLYKKYGFVNATSNGGFFAFNTQYTFYEISLVTRIINNGVYEDTSKAIIHNFYIDGTTPEWNNATVSNNTIIAGVYDNGNKVNDYTFNNQGILSDTVGGNEVVQFEIAYSTRSEGNLSDHRENKMLLMRLSNSEGNSHLCNVHLLVTKDEDSYSTLCRNLIDKEATKAFYAEGKYIIVFSVSGEYNVSFIDVSGNEIGFNFFIDKTAPEVAMNSASAGIYDGIKVDYREINFTSKEIDNKINYYLGSYVKDPKITIAISDLTPSSVSYCYSIKFKDYEEVVPCVNNAVLNEVYEIGLTIEAINALKQAKFNGDVVIEIYAIDGKNNNGIDKAIRVHFWVDYSAPVISFNYDPDDSVDQNGIFLNTTRITHEELDPQGQPSYRINTITVSSNDYSGKIIACNYDEELSKNIFSFIDSRTSYNYEFSAECSDGHENGEEGTYSQPFDNTMYIKFYESLDGVNRNVDNQSVDGYEAFNFGLSTTDEGNARWIYITLVDSVGNEAENHIVLPIFVKDKTSPTIEKAYKENATQPGDFSQVINALNYTHPAASVYNVSGVYLANTSIRVVYSEPIALVTTCKIFVSKEGGESLDLNNALDCSEYANKSYRYGEYMTTFEFKNEEHDKYVIVILGVEDFAENPSDLIAIVIDKVAPKISHTENGALNGELEYLSSTKTYSSAYANTGHTEDVVTEDDQQANVSVIVQYYKYSPTITYKNYYYDSSDRKYKKVDDFQTKEAGINYYVLIEKSQILNNSKCAANVTLNYVDYCYVIDTQGHYYYDSLLKNETVWTAVSSINSSKSGVYRINYYAKDAAGNISGTIYKKIFVNDTKNPDIDIYVDSVNNVQYSNVASNNPERFAGKHNQAIGFTGTDKFNNNDSKVRIVYYKCSTEAYNEGISPCNKITSQTLYENPSIQYDKEAYRRIETTTSNSIRTSRDDPNGIYKVFAYDIGQYTTTVTPEKMYYGDSTLDPKETIYILTKNSVSINLAIDRTLPSANYTIYGNQYATKDSIDTNIDYVSSDINYYKMETTSTDKDVTLVRYINGSYVDISGENAIGYSKMFAEMNGDVITVKYKNVNDAVVYEVKYEKADTSDGLLLHKTYHRVGTQYINENNTVTTEVCIVRDGLNSCIGHEDELYTVVNVVAYLRAEGSYNVRFMDRYGNLTTETAPFIVDNTPYTTNKENFRPTGINYWFSVPSQVMTKNNQHLFAEIKDVAYGNDIDVLESKYTNNFNSEFFYAFASMEDAKLYLQMIYNAEVRNGIRENGYYNFLKLDGSTYRFDKVDDVKVAELVSNFIFTTYTGESKFSNQNILQKSGDLSLVDPGSGVTNRSSMYEYVNLAVITYINQFGQYEYRYKIADSCTDPLLDLSAAEKCLYTVKVELKIVKAGTQVDLADAFATEYNVTCVATAGTGTGTNGGCEITSVQAGAIYIFIDRDVNAYHNNFVYYGLTSYNLSKTKTNYKLLGEYIPLSKFERYLNPNDSQTDPTGNYIWLDLEYVSIDSIINTNLYTTESSLCSDPANGCVYVTYFGQYRYSNSYYIPDSEGDWYYDYNYVNENKKYLEKEDIMEKYNVDSTYSEYGNWGDGASNSRVPSKVTNYVVNITNEHVLMDPQTNKKAYIELFSGEVGESIESSILPESFFEVNAISKTEIYSYLTLAIISYNGSIDRYENINNYIYKEYGENGATGKFKCILDVDLNDIYEAWVMDRAGNTLVIKFSHADMIPEITYPDMSGAATDAAVDIQITASSNIAMFSTSSVTIYKQDISTGEYGDPIDDKTCYEFLGNVGTNLQRALTLRFKYVVGRNCSGVYKVKVVDNHGNSSYKEFVFNPHVNDAFYSITETDDNKKYVYTETADNVDVNGVIVGKEFQIQFNYVLYYMVVNKYEPYSNLNLSASDSKEELVISEFKQDKDGNLISEKYYFGDDSNKCFVTSSIIAGLKDYAIMTISALNLDGGICDGVYTVDVVNRFSNDIAKKASEYESLDGTYSDSIVYRLSYGSSETIEIDTMAPPLEIGSSNDGGSEYYFTLEIDDEIQYDDIESLLNGNNVIYTNQYLTVAWGGYEEYSLTYLQYRLSKYNDQSKTESDEPWKTVSQGVTYSPTYAANHEFKISLPGIYEYTLMFVDAVGNASETRKITFKVVPPNVALFEIDEKGAAGEKYQNDVRVADGALLRCLDNVNGYCNASDYNYRLSINNKLVQGFGNETIDLIKPFTRENLSLWTQTNDEELIVVLVVSIKGKDDINTVLRFIIDNKAPGIDVSGSTIGSTYTGTVTVRVSQEDKTNYALIYACMEIKDEKCYTYNKSGALLNYDVGMDLVANVNQFARIDKDTPFIAIANNLSGYFAIVAMDDLGNMATKWFVMDNEAPTISVYTDNSVIAPNMYTNAKAVFVTVNDRLSQKGSNFTIEYAPLNSDEETTITYDSLVGLTKEGKYVLTPKDAVDIEGRSISFYIYRQTPQYTLSTNNDDPNVVDSEVALSWEISKNKLVAPIVSVTVDGKAYQAEYNVSGDKVFYIGEKITSVGEHIFVVTDAAGNRAVIMVTINNSKKVCINGLEIEVKMQAYHNINDLLIGKDGNIKYEKDDVIIFALPTQTTTGSCVENGLLAYRTLDPENSNYLIETDRAAELFNNNEYNFVEYGFISEEAINEVKNVGGTVVVFVVTKEIANNQLGYAVGTNFFIEDPLGWTMIFVSVLSLVWPACRIFIKKKVRVI